jgi:uncharacterized membrane protein (UPF0127 family)
MGKLLTGLLLFSLMACQSESRLSEQTKNHGFGTIELVTPAGDRIKTVLAVSEREQVQGLSGVRPDNFAKDEGMLFFYFADDERHFWMPDTYFDLDIIYLDKNLRILDINRRVPHYIGRANPSVIPRARPVWARHALEMRADSPISQKLKAGDQLEWQAKLNLQEAEKQLRPAAK